VIQDARSLADGSELECDVCVVGAGAAGITLAREFAGGDVRVCLLESGGFEPDEAVQDLYRGVARGTILGPGSHYLAGGRLRYFGGTTNHWQGWCRPFEPIDFTARPWIAASGWPFDRSHLDPWYGRARAVIGLAAFDDDAVAAAAGPPPLLPGGSRVPTRFYYLQPTRFGVAHRARLAAAPNLRVLLHASAVGVRVGAGDDRVRRIDAATLAGTRFAVLARWFVLACGGIENARLLLLSDDARERGLGNERDLVGRYFCDHPHLEAGHALLFRGEESLRLYDYAFDPRLGQTRIGVLGLAPEAQREHELLNCSVELRAADAVSRPELADPLGAVAPLLDRPGQDPPARSTTTLATLTVRTETTPNPESRVTLTGERDALGQRRPKLAWRILPGDRRRLRRALAVVGSELGRQGVGRVHLVEPGEAPWRGAYGGHHHIGTTRMHPDPHRGVVDADCRVHSTANLFVAGSSVFPTSGFANPTLTLVALAIRLADHLKARLEG
jgi:choline dehydrogenase-like flavoprotein